MRKWMNGLVILAARAIAGCGRAQGGAEAAVPDTADGIVDARSATTFGD